MKILRDDGEYKHIRFSKPTSRAYYFDLITWPGHFSVVGDMGDWFFRRSMDIFRGPISHHYWKEKLLASSVNSTEFSAEQFQSAILEDLEQWGEDRCSPEELQILKNQASNDLLQDITTDSVRCAYEWEYQIRPSLTFRFSDVYEHSFEEYTFHFMWICHAIQWGIQQYDNFILQTTPASPSP